jgi:Sugar-transfer associated ATP-grasp
MNVRSRAGNASSVPARIVLALAGAFAALTGLAQFLATTPAWRFDSPVQFNADFAVGVGLVWTFLQAFLNRGSTLVRRRWLVAGGAMLLLAAIQATDWQVDVGGLSDDWFVDLPMWLAVSLLVRRVLRQAGDNRWALHAWRVGLCLQVVFVVCDFADGRFVGTWLASPERVAALTEWAELLAIESYVVALVLLEVAPGATLLRGVSLAVGAEARRVFEMAHLFRKASYPPFRWAHYPLARGLLAVVACLGLVATIGPAARRASGRSLLAQLADLLRLALREGFDPVSYYLQDLHRRGGRAEAAYYLTRYETKNGLLHALNGMRRRPYAGSELSDKLLFADCCRKFGLATPGVLLACDAAGAQWLAPRDALDQDLCCKPRKGRGARGIAIFERIANERYRTSEGDEIDLDQLVERLRVRGRSTPLIVQPRLVNHAAIADLAQRSLVAIRVVTCLDAVGRPVVTHGVLRILSKLEPDWPGDDEYGTAVDLATGRLGPLSSDRLARCTLHWSCHPVTGQAVEGRFLVAWPEIQALAVAAHQAFAHRTLIGWDIAWTPDGPVLLEGNNSLDVMFPQRVYHQGIGRGPLGPLLQHHLAALGRSRGIDRETR